GRRRRRPRARLHGAPPGHVRGRHRERPARRRHAGALSRRAHREGRRSVAPGAGAAGRRSRSAASRGGEDGGPRPRPGRPGVEPDAYEAIFSEDRAEIRRRDGAIATTLEVVVSPEDDAEVRRVTITNLGGRTRQIELTSYAEVVLAPPAADAAHPVFSNLFVHTEADPVPNTLLATRRPRSPGDPPVWAAHVVAVDQHTVGGIQYETDRARFLGRGRSIRTPVSVIDGRPLC